jgi:putative redox protein
MTTVNPVADPAAPKPPSRVLAKWTGGMTFDSAREGGRAIRMDGTSEDGQSPVDILLSALAGCAAMDVVEILKKQRTPVESLEVEVIGERVDAVPRRFKHITLNFHIAGAGIDQAQAERAISLSINKYCSVGASLSSDIKVEWTLTLGAAPNTP